VIDHPHTAGLIGAFWLTKQGLLISNSEMLVKLLNVKSNSLNTNFREHGFSNLGMIPQDQLFRLAANLPGLQLKNLRNWKKRKHITDIFTPMMTLEDAIDWDSK
jgi:hypothetical protein